jgi:hypothetical protein
MPVFGTTEFTILSGRDRHRKLEWRIRQELVAGPRLWAPFVKESDHFQQNEVLHAVNCGSFRTLSDPFRRGRGLLLSIAWGI